MTVKFYCNFCKVEMKHQVLTEKSGEKLKHDDTHIYVCGDCPNVTIELCDNNDLKRLSNYLMGGVK